MKLSPEIDQFLRKLDPNYDYNPWDMESSFKVVAAESSEELLSPEFNWDEPIEEPEFNGEPVADDSEIKSVRDNLNIMAMEAARANNQKVAYLIELAVSELDDLLEG